MPESKNKKTINPVKVGIAGAAVVAAGAAVVLSKKENRKKAGKVLKNLKVKGEKLTKQAAVGLDKIMKDEELLQNVANTAISTVRKAAKTAPKVNEVRKNVVKAVKLKSGAKTRKKTGKPNSK